MVLVVPLTRYFDAINCFHRCTGPMSPKILKKVEKFAKIRFFSQFSGLDMAIFRAKICSTWPEMVPVVPPARYFDALICFQRIEVHGPQKIGRKLKKLQKINFPGQICRDWCAWEVLKSDPKVGFWCSLGSGRGFGICKPVSKCLLRFLRQLDGPKMKSSKKRHFSAPFPY